MDGFKSIEIKKIWDINRLKTDDFSRLNVFLSPNRLGKNLKTCQSFKV
jgi:hypothetical protein